MRLREKPSPPHRNSEEPGTWLRARRPEHKRQRREAILAAAVDLLDVVGVEGASLSAIARGAGLSKTNCYRYFESREAILLAVALEEFRGWVVDVEVGLGPLAGSSEVEGCATVIARSTAVRPRLCMLSNSLAAVLERNVAPDTVASFKRGTAELLLRAVAALEAALPGLRGEATTAFFTLYNLGLAGAWPAANPAPVLAEVLAREEFEHMRVDLEPTLERLARALLRGLMADRE